MTRPLFFVQTAPTTEGWALALRSNQPEFLGANEDLLLNAGFRKTAKGHFVLTTREEAGILSLPQEVRELLSETHFASMQEPTPWVVADELGITYQANSRDGGQTTTVIAKAGVAAHASLLYAGFKKTEKGVLYLAHPDNRAFKSHEEMVRHLFQVSRMAASYMGKATKTVSLTVIPNKEVLGKVQAVSRNTVFEMPSLVAALQPADEPGIAIGEQGLEVSQTDEKKQEIPAAPPEPLAPLVETEGVAALAKRAADAVSSHSNNFIALLHPNLGQPLSVIVQNGLLRRVDVLAELEDGFAVSTSIDISEGGQVNKALVVGPDGEESLDLIGQQAVNQFKLFSDLTERPGIKGDWYLVDNEVSNALEMDVDAYTQALGAKLSDRALVELTAQESVVAGKVNLDAVLDSDAVMVSENAIGEWVYQRGEERFVLNSSGEEVLFSSGAEVSSQLENPRFLVLDPEAAGPTVLATVLSYTTPLLDELVRGSVTADQIAKELEPVAGSHEVFSQDFWNSLNMAAHILNSHDARKPLEARQLAEPPALYKSETESKAAFSEFVNQVASSSHIVISELMAAPKHSPEETEQEAVAVIKSEIGTHAGKMHVDDVVADIASSSVKAGPAKRRQQPTGLENIAKIKDALEQDFRELRASERRGAGVRVGKVADLEEVLKSVISDNALEGVLLDGYPVAFAQVERLELLKQYPIDRAVAADYVASLSVLKAESKAETQDSDQKDFQNLSNLAKHTYDMKDPGLLVTPGNDLNNSEEAEYESVVRHDDAPLEGAPTNESGQTDGRGEADGESTAQRSTESSGPDYKGDGPAERKESDERVGGLGGVVEQVHASGSGTGRDNAAPERAGSGLTLFSAAPEELGIELGDAKPLLELLQSIDEDGAKLIGTIRFGQKGKAHELFHIPSTNTIFPGYQNGNQIQVALGFNSEGEIVRVDQARARSRERAPNIFATEKVLLRPTRAGMNTQLQTLDDDFKIAAPYVESNLVMVHLNKESAFESAHSNAAKVATAVEELMIDVTLMDSVKDITDMVDLLKATSNKSFINEFNQIAEEELLVLSPAMTPIAEYAFNHSPAVNNNYPYGHLIDSKFGSVEPEALKELVIDLSDIPELPLRISKGFLPRDASDKVIYELATQIDGALTQYLAGEEPVGMLVATKNNDGTTISATNFLTKKTMFIRNGMSLEDAVKSSSGNASPNMRILNVENAYAREDISRVCIDILTEPSLVDWQGTVEEVSPTWSSASNNTIYPSKGAKGRLESLVRSGVSIGSIPFLNDIDGNQPEHLSYAHTVMVHPAGTYKKTIASNTEILSVTQASLVTLESKYGRLMGYNPEGHALYQGENGLRSINNGGSIETEPYLRAHASVNTSVIVKLPYAKNTFEIETPIQQEHIKFSEHFFTVEMDDSQLAAYGETLAAQIEMKALDFNSFQYNTILNPGIERVASLDRERKIVDEALIAASFGREVEANLDIKISNMRIVQVSEKAIVVTGDTKPHKDALGKAGIKGIFKKNIQGHTGWMFPLKRLEEVEKTVLELAAGTVQVRKAVLASDTKLQKIISGIETEQEKLNTKQDFKIDLGTAGVSSLPAIEAELQELTLKIDDAIAGKMINALNSGDLDYVEPSIIRSYGAYTDVREALHSFIVKAPLTIFRKQAPAKDKAPESAYDEAIKFIAIRNGATSALDTRIYDYLSDKKLGKELYEFSVTSADTWASRVIKEAEQAKLNERTPGQELGGESEKYLQVTGEYENSDTIGLTIPDDLIRQLNNVLSQSEITADQAEADGTVTVYFRDSALTRTYGVEIDTAGKIGFISNYKRIEDDWIERKFFDFTDNAYRENDSFVETSISRNTTDHPHNFKFHIRSFVHEIESGTFNINHSLSDITRYYNGRELGAVVPGKEPLSTELDHEKAPVESTHLAEPETIPSNVVPVETKATESVEFVDSDPMVLIQGCENQQRANITLTKGVIEHVNNVLRDEGITKGMAYQQGMLYVTFEDPEYKKNMGSGVRPVEFGINPEGSLAYINEYAYDGISDTNLSLAFGFTDNSFHNTEWGLSNSLTGLKNSDAGFIRTYFSNFNNYAQMGSYHVTHSLSDKPREYDGRKLGGYYHAQAEIDAGPVEKEDQAPVKVGLDVLDANSDPRLNDWLTNSEISPAQIAQALVEARIGNNIRLENGTVAVIRTLPGRNAVSVSPEYDSVKYEPVSYKHIFGDEKAIEIEEHLMPLMAAQVNYTEREPVLIRELPIFESTDTRYAGELINTHFGDLSAPMTAALQSNPIDDLNKSLPGRRFADLVKDMKEFASIAKDGSNLAIEFIHAGANNDHARIQSLFETQASMAVNHSLLGSKHSILKTPAINAIDLNHVARQAAVNLVQGYVTTQVAAYGGKDLEFNDRIGLIPDGHGNYDTLLKTSRDIVQIAADSTGSKKLTAEEFEEAFQSVKTIQIIFDPSYLTKKGFLLSAEALRAELSNKELRELGSEGEGIRTKLIKDRLSFTSIKKAKTPAPANNKAEPNPIPKPTVKLESGSITHEEFAPFAHQEVVEGNTSWADFVNDEPDLVDSLLDKRIADAYDVFLDAGAVQYNANTPWPLYLNESIIDLQTKNDGANNQRFGFSVSAGHLPTTTFVDDIHFLPQDLAKLVVSSTINPEFIRRADTSVANNPPAQSKETIRQSKPTTHGKAGQPAVASGVTPKVDTVDDVFSLEGAQDIGTGGSVTKYKRNIEAIALLKDLELTAIDKTGNAKLINPTQEEKAVLSLYVGWGGIPEAFRKPNGGFVNGWEERALALESLLTEVELDSAARSTLNAHFTSMEVVDAMYAGLQRIGVKGPFKMIEPALGTGNFIGRMPKELRENAAVTGIELDSLTGRMAAGTYTDKNTKILSGMGYQEFNQTGGSYDVAIGNPPYGAYRVFDANFPQLSGTIHNFFSLKSLELLRPGGIKAFVTSRYVMDSIDPKIRKTMAEQADLLSAIRLPDDAFKANAGTEVVTDILFFQRRSEALPKDEKGATIYPDWVDTTSIPVMKKDSEEQLPFNVNDFFIENPSNVLGEPVVSTGMYREGLTYKAIDDGRTFAEQLADVIETLPQGVYEPANTVLAYEREHLKGVLVGENSINRDLTGISIGTMFTYEDKVWERINDVDTEWAAKKVDYRLDSKGQEVGLSEKEYQRLYGMVSIREAGDKLIKLERETNGDVPEVEAARKDLGQQYDRFVKKFGFLNRPSNVRFVRQDSAYVRIVALEVDYVPGIKPNNSKGKRPQKETAKKSDIFHERVASFDKENNLTAENPEDALAISLKERGKPDVEYMCELLDKPQEEILEALKDSLYLDPVTNTHTWAPIYLSGNVRKKLKQAELAAASEDGFDTNIAALKANQPKTIPIEDVGIQFGAHWIPRSILIGFVRHCAKDDKLDVKAHYNKGTGEWRIKTATNPMLNSEWSTDRAPISKIIQSAANNAPIKIFDDVPQGPGLGDKRVLNEKATTEANQIVDRFKKSFGLWTLESADRANLLESEYNEKVNCTVRADIVAPAGYYPKGIIDKSIFEFREHQINYIFRSMMQANIGAIHCVGAGKTSAEIAATMEQVRVGQCAKPIIVVPNHLTGHWAKEIQRLYPSASILVPDGKKDFMKVNRQKLFARIATGNWNFVVIAHSQLIKLPTDKELERDFIKEEIANLEDSLKEAQADAESPRDVTVKRLEKQKLDTEARLEEAISKADVDTGVTFGQLGIDKISVDEFHKFKNLAYSTKLNVSGLGNPTGSKKAFDAFVKISSVSKKGGKLSALTATPISNTIAEMYTYLRYMAPEALKDRGIYSFDAWARVFAEVTTELELKITGDGYRINSRLSKFHNLPELMDMYLDVNDTIALADMKATVEKNGGKWFVPSIRGGKPENIIIPLSVDQIEQMEEINERAEMLEDPDTFVDPKEDNKLKLLSDSTKCALDPRIDEPDLDEPEVGKLKTTYDILIAEDKMAIEKYGRSGVQLVFCDLGVPKSAKGLEREKLRVILDAMESDDEPTRIKAEGEYEKYSPAEVESIMSEDAFCFQDALRSKLTASGEYFEEHEVASLHDVKSDKERLELYRRCNTGEIKALLCTTSKGGEGMNVNRYALGVIDVDAPWRPSDLIQRIGRVVRQNNWFFEEFPEFEVYVKNLATERSTDAWKYQTLEKKEAALSQIVNGRVSERTIEDVGVSTESLSEMKAMSSGNDLIFRQHKIQQQIKSLDTDLSIQHSQVSRYRRDKQSLESRLKSLPIEIEQLERFKETMASYPTGSVEVMAENAKGKMEKVERSVLTVEMKTGKKIQTAMEGGKAILYEMMRLNKNKEFEDQLIAKVNGVDLYVTKYKSIWGDDMVQCEFTNGEKTVSASYSVLEESLVGFGGKIKRFLEREVGHLRSLDYDLRRIKDGYEKFLAVTPPEIDEQIKGKLKAAQIEELDVIDLINAQEQVPATLEEVVTRMKAFDRKYKGIADQDSIFKREFDDTIQSYENKIAIIESGEEIEKNQFSQFAVLASKTAKHLKKELGLSRKVIVAPTVKTEERVAKAVIITDPGVIDSVIQEYDDKFKWMSANEKFSLIYDSAKNRLNEASEIMNAAGGYPQEKLNEMVERITDDAVTVQTLHKLIQPVSNEDLSKSIINDAVEEEPTPQMF